MHKNSIKAFTLVELIVVITILAILWTIAFISLQWYSAYARDSVRVSDIKNAETWLELFVLKAWKYPEPDNLVSYTWWTSEIKQWIVWENVTRNIALDKIIKDPLTDDNYVYSIFWKWQYYQLAADQENIDTALIQSTYASAPVTSIVKWNYKFDPSLPSLILVPSSVSWSWIFDPNVCFVLDWWKNTLNNCVEKKLEMNLDEFDTGLVWYWDMETTFSSGGIDYLKDLSGNGNYGVFEWTMTYSSSFTWWTIGNWLNFNGDWYIEILDSISLNPNNNNITLISTFIYKISPYISGNTWIIEKTYTSLVEPYYQYKLWLTPNNHNTYNNWALSSTFSINEIRASDTYSNINPFYDWQLVNFVSTYNGQTMKFYLNGNNVNEINLIWELWQYSSNLCFWKSFCSLSNSPSEYLYAIIDDIKIYNRALSDEEILQQARIAGF